MAYSNDMFGLQQLMADEQAAQQQSNINNAVNLASTKGAGMMYRAGGIGDQRGQAYASLGRMLTGETEPVDPRMARMQKLEEIRKKVPAPETAEDFKRLARLLDGAGLYDEARKAIEMSNDIIKSTPARTKTKAADGYYYFDDTGERVFGDVKKTEAEINDPKKLAFSLFTKSPEYLASTNKSEAVLKWSQDWDAKNNQGEMSYAEKIAEIEKMINPATGELYTYSEAVEREDQNKRETSKQKITVAAAKNDIEYTNTAVANLNEKADTASSALQSYDNIIKAYEAGGRTGKLEKAFLDIKGVLRTLGYQGDINEISSSEVLLAEFNNIALDNMKKLSGSASDKDVAFVVSGGPSYDKSPEANQILIGQAMHLSKEVINATAFQNKWIGNYLKMNKGVYPKQWELNAAMSAFANRGDTSPDKLARYGTVWESEAFKSVGTREELVAIYGNNIYDGWAKYNKIKQQDLTVENETTQNISIVDAARLIAEEDEED